MMRSDTLSVALCTYNGADFLPDLLSSLDRQTRPPDDVVVCDDRSSDRTPEILRTWASSARFPVRIFSNETRLTTTANFSKACGLCRGTLIAFCDQDDVWHPEKIERVVARLHRSNAVALLHDSRVVREDGGGSGSLWSMLKFSERERRWFAHDDAMRVLLKHNVVTGAATVVRAGVIDVARPFSPHGAHDVWIGLIAARMGSIELDPVQLIDYRQHGANQVGAPVRSYRAKLRRRQSLDDVSAREMAQLCDLLQRLEERAADVRDLPVQQLVAKVAHLRARSQLPGGLLARLPAVLTELGRRRYHRFGRGFDSALYDLLYRDDRHSARARSKM